MWIKQSFLHKLRFDPYPVPARLFNDRTKTHFQPDGSRPARKSCGTNNKHCRGCGQPTTEIQVSRGNNLCVISSGSEY
jgi:hypothetical protein